MTVDLRAAAIAARETAYAALATYNDHARTCKDVCEYDLHWKCDTGTALQAAILEGADAAWNALAAYAPAGTTVTYHGSIAEHHGMWMVQSVTAGSFGSAVTLARNNGSAGQLSHVRIESFTVEQPQAKDPTTARKQLAQRVREATDAQQDAADRADDLDGGR